MKSVKYKILVFILLSILLSSCKTTKYVKDKEYLLSKLKLNIDNKEINYNEVKNVVKQNPNVRILGIFKFHLALYNLSSKKQENGISAWLRRIGEEPIIYDEYKAHRSTKQIKLFLKNKGYFNAIVTDTVNIKGKKANLTYNIIAGKPYVYNKVYREFNKLPFNFKNKKISKIELPDSALLRKYIIQDTNNSLIKKNIKVDSDILDSERSRVSKMLRNKGYFNFSKNNVRFYLDSAKNNNSMDVFLGIEKPLKNKKYKKFFFGKIKIFTDFDQNSKLSKDSIYLNTLDSLDYGNIRFFFRGKMKIKPSVLKRNIYFLQGQVYDLKSVEESYIALQALKQYKFVNIRFNEVKGSVLNCEIQLTPLKRQSYTFEIEGTNSSGNLGAAGSYTYQHRNIFKGAEIFSLKLSGARERLYASNKQIFDATEISGEVKLNLPKFFIPFFSADKFKREYKPKTMIALSHSYQKRPDYTRTIADISFGYYWKSSKHIRHILNPMELNFIQVKNLSSEFIKSIRNKYISNSFKDHLITNTRYSFLFSNKSKRNNLDYHYLRFNTEIAGNTLSLFSKLFKRKKVISTDLLDYNDSFYDIFNVRYAQYVKADIEYRFNHYMNKANSIVYRIFAGIGVPYGNLKVLPFSKSYFSGGANGIRAWNIRSLGPGGYTDNNLFYNNAADMKLEANLEYRFKLIWSLEGALFVDAGNIWSVTDKDYRPESLFKLNKFYKQIAIGTGFGLRADLKFVVLRLDLGMKVKNPALKTNTKWLTPKAFFRYSNITYNIGIGYPF